MPWFLPCLFRLSSSAVIYMAVYVEQPPPVSWKREREGGVVTPLTILLSTLSQPESKTPLHSLIHIPKLCNSVLRILKHSSPSCCPDHQTSEKECIQVRTSGNCNYVINWHSDIHWCVHAYMSHMQIYMYTKRHGISNVDTHRQKSSWTNPKCKSWSEREQIGFAV